MKSQSILAALTALVASSTAMVINIKVPDFVTKYNQLGLLSPSGTLSCDGMGYGMYCDKEGTIVITRETCPDHCSCTDKGFECTKASYICEAAAIHDYCYLQAKCTCA